MPNPYQPPPQKESEAEQSRSDGKSSPEARSSTWPTLIFFVGVMSAVATVYFVRLAMRLRSRFPDLHDPSPNVDGYWPGLFHDLYLLWAGALGLAAVALFAISIALRRQSRGTINSNHTGKIQTDEAR